MVLASAGALLERAHHRVTGMIEYKDFTIQIGPASGSVYPILIDSPAGRAESTFEFAFLESESIRQELSRLGQQMRSGSQRAMYVDIDAEDPAEQAAVDRLGVG